MFTFDFLVYFVPYFYVQLSHFLHKISQDFSKFNMTFNKGLINEFNQVFPQMQNL